MTCILTCRLRENQSQLGTSKLPLLEVQVLSVHTVLTPTRRGAIVLCQQSNIDSTPDQFTPLGPTVIQKTTNTPHAWLFNRQTAMGAGVELWCCDLNCAQGRHILYSQAKLGVHFGKHPGCAQ